CGADVAVGAVGEAADVGDVDAAALARPLRADADVVDARAALEADGCVERLPLGLHEAEAALAAHPLEAGVAHVPGIDERVDLGGELDVALAVGLADVQ